MFKAIPLFSGSSGNCTYIKYGDDEILVDAGKSREEIYEKYAEKYWQPLKAQEQPYEAFAINSKHSTIIGLISSTVLFAYLA